MLASYNADQHLDCIRIVERDRSGSAAPADVMVLQESTIEIVVNDAALLTVNCTPSNLIELVYGRLFAEGCIQCANDVLSLEFDPVEDRFITQVKEPLPPAATLLQPYPFATWRESDIFALSDSFLQDTPLHSITSGTHSCRLVLQGKTVIVFEDIGRHNAMDKVIGHALLNGIDLHDAIVFSSGRMPVDMVKKAVRAKLGVLVSKAAPTNQGVRMAQEYGLVMIKCKGDKLQVFSG